MARQIGESAERFNAIDVRIDASGDLGEKIKAAIQEPLERVVSLRAQEDAEQLAARSRRAAALATGARVLF